MIKGIRIFLQNVVFNPRAESCALASFWLSVLLFCTWSSALTLGAIAYAVVATVIVVISARVLMRFALPN